MMRTAAALTLVSVVSVLGQEPQRNVTFDVTSVKPNSSGEQGGSSSARPGRYVGINVTLRRVMGLAYRPVQEFAGGPDWINTERFDIEGRSEGTPTQPQMLEMLRALLAERSGWSSTRKYGRCLRSRSSWLARMAEPVRGAAASLSATAR